MSRALQVVLLQGCGELTINSEDINTPFSFMLILLYYRYNVPCVADFFAIPTPNRIRIHKALNFNSSLSNHQNLWASMPESDVTAPGTYQGRLPESPAVKRHISNTPSEKIDLFNLSTLGLYSVTRGSGMLCFE